MHNGVSTRRDFLRLVTVGGAGLALAGCVAEPAAQAPAPSSGSLNPADVKGALSYWNSFTGEDERAGFQSVVDSFQAAYPNVDFQVEAVPNADFMTKFTTAVQSRSGPDTVMALMERFPDMVGMNGLTDLTGFAADWGGLGEFDRKMLDPLTVDGKLYALPALAFVDWIYYRADWFEEAGISAPPRTWDEFRQVARAITDPGRDRYGFGMRGGAGGGTAIIKVINSYNGPLTSPDGRSATLDLDAAVEALRLYTGLYTQDHAVPPSAPNDSYNQIFQSFLNGRTGMLLHHTGSLQSVQKALRPMEQVRTMVVPKARFEGTWILPGGNGLMTSTGNADAAFAWLTHWAKPATQVDFLKATGYWPTATAAQQDPFVTGNPLYEAATEAVSIGGTPTFFRGFQGWMDTVVLVETQNVLVGRKSVEEAAGVMVDSLRSIIEENR
jgi:multiple sugar transport system substrate-binding protein